MITKEFFEKGIAFSAKIIESLRKSPTPYHVVENSINKLCKQGFKPLPENEIWNNLNPGDKFFITRNQSSIIAFSLGKNFDCKKSCFQIVGAHTDSPAIRLCPNSKVSKTGFQQVAVTLY